MRNSVIILLAIALLTPVLARADHSGPVTPPVVGTANPAPTAGADGALVLQKPSLSAGATALGTSGNTVDNQGSSPIATGADTSTAAPGGQAESSKNGALSIPAEGHHKKPKPAPDDGDTPK